MKQYKLLKDLPFAKAGEIVEIWSDGTIVFDDTPSLVRFNKKDVRLFPHWFEEIEVKGWAINTLNSRIEEISDISYSEWAIKNLKSLGLAFKTKEEAEKHLEWLKARAILLEDAKGFKPDWNDSTQPKWYVEYDYEDFDFNIEYSLFQNAGAIYFATEENAERSIELHEKEWKIYLEVE